MSIPLNINGAVFEYPVNFDENWGIDATGWAQAVTNGMLQMAGGNFPLTADVNFGASFGLVSSYYKSRSSNIATAGVVRLASADAIEWRNSTNTGNNILNVVGDNLTYNGGAITNTSLTNTHIYVGNASNVPADVALSGDATITNTGVLTIGNGAVTAAKISSGTITDTQINGSASIAVTKLAALTANRAVATNVSGFITPSSTTDTELGYISGVTSSIQTQLGTKLNLSGGTMSGAIAMGNNKITGLANGTAATDAAAFGQLLTFTDWTAYTPTVAGGGTLVVNQTFYMRLGNTIWVKGVVDFGTTTATPLSITLPAGTVINTAKIGGSGSGIPSLLGQARILFNAAGPATQTTANMINIFFDAVDTTKVYGSVSTGSQTWAKTNTTVFAAANDCMAFEFSYPV